MQKLKRFLFIVTLALTAGNPLLVMAQPANTNTPTKVDVPVYQNVQQSIESFLCTPSVGPDDRALEKCINKIYRFGITFGAIALVFFLVYAGYMYIAGGESGKTAAKGVVQNALVGMALLLGSYVLLSFINPNLVVFKPIQPPIFSAADLPSCAAVGLGESCMLAGGGVSFGGAGACSIPIDPSKVYGFNSSVHNPWDNNPETPDRHRTVRNPPDSPPPQGAVDLRVGPKQLEPVYSPISGKVVLRRDPNNFPGEYITITSDIRPGSTGCGSADSCANLAHIDPTVNVGDTVTAGQQIGKTHNNTGSLGPVLHLELKLGGQWITGDGKQGTWDNMKRACSASGSNTSSAVAVDMSKAPTGMVEITESSHGVKLNMKYATSDNFTGTVMYKQAKCYLTQTMANQLKNAQTALTAKGKQLEVYDCYRPTAVQTLMNDWAKGTAKWAVKKPSESYNFYVPKYIAASTGGNHPAGKAIDLTISGSSMPSAFDTFNSTSAYSASNADAKLLRDTMVAAKFAPLNSEWWHFSE